MKSWVIQNFVTFDSHIILTNMAAKLLDRALFVNIRKTPVNINKLKKNNKKCLSQRSKKCNYDAQLHFFNYLGKANGNSGRNIDSIPLEYFAVSNLK